jgi:hypothetical protein
MIRLITPIDIDKINKPSNLQDYINDPYCVGFCTQDCEKYILINFNPFFNYWKIDFLSFEIDSRHKVKLFFQMLKYISEYAEERDFFQFLIYLKVKDYTNYNYFFEKYIGKYEVAIDELVKANERPVTTAYWQWLFDGQLKEHDTIIAHHFLRSTHRTKIRGLIECL